MLHNDGFDDLEKKLKIRSSYSGHRKGFTFQNLTE
jgi:hypothetical protein